jgi:hypothetical protein
MGRGAGLVAVGVLLSAALGGVVMYARGATIVVQLPPKLIQSQATVTGGRDSGYFPTRQVTVDVSERLRSAASPAEAGTYATGQVVFSHYSGCTHECWNRYMMPAGYELLSRGGVAYRTLADVWWKDGTISAPVGIRAEVPGPAGNAGPHAIFETRLWPGWMVPDNPKPITGGTSRITHRVTQRDLDDALASLYQKLQPEVQNAMRVNASVLVFTEAGTPRYTYTVDHAVGDETPFFTATMTASLSANGFSDKQARAMFASSLGSHDGQVWVSYAIDELAPNGDVRLRGAAAAFGIASPDPRPWQKRLASMRVDAARNELLKAFPGAEVQIQTYGVPWLPAAPDRIKLVFEPLPSYPA